MARTKDYFKPCFLLSSIIISFAPFALGGWEPQDCPTNQTACFTIYEGNFFGCYDLNNDPAHCLDCFTKCPGPTANGYGTCTGGMCQCKPGFTYCRYFRWVDYSFQRDYRICSNLNSDPDNCGACDSPCPRLGPCTNGRCFPCPSGYTECMGTDNFNNPERYCAKLSTDRENCGSCGTWCPYPTLYCYSGRCGGNPSSPPPPRPPSPSPPRPPPPPPPYFPPISWLPSLIPVSSFKFFSPLTTSFTSNGGAFYTLNATNNLPDRPTAKASGYGPCPYWTTSGIKPDFTLPVTDITTLATNTVTQATSFFTSSRLNLTRANSAGMASFGAEFFFQLTPDGCIEDGFSPNARDTDTCGSGFLFTIQSQGKNSVGYWGPDIGYGNITAPAGTNVNSVKKSVAVEFDTKQSSKMLETDGNHIAVDVNGSPRHNMSDTKRYAKITQNLADGNIKHAVIVYNANAKLLLVYFADDPASAPRLLISYPLDVRKNMDVSRAYFGFTAATGILPNLMNLKVYDFRVFYAPGTTNPAPLSPPVAFPCPPPPASVPPPSPSKAPDPNRGPATAPAPAPAPAPGPTRK